MSSEAEESSDLFDVPAKAGEVEGREAALIMNPTPALFASPARPTTVAHKVRVAVVHEELVARLYVFHCHVRNRIGEVAIDVVVVSSITVLIVTVVAVVVATLPSATLLPLSASTSASGPALTPATALAKALLPALLPTLPPAWLALTSSSVRRKKGHSHVGSAAGGRGGHRVDVQQRVPEREHRAIARVRRIDGPRSPPLQSLVCRAPQHAPVHPDDVPGGERSQCIGPAPGASHGRRTHGDGLAPQHGLNLRLRGE